MGSLGPTLAIAVNTLRQSIERAEHVGRANEHALHLSALLL